MNLGLESIAPKTIPSTSCSFEEVLIAQSESAEASFNLTNYVNTFSNLVDIYNHISKFGITEESKSLFSASFESVGLTFSTESVLTIIKNTISRIREWIKTFIEKIKEFFAKFLSNSNDRINEIKKKIAEIKAMEQKYRFDNLASDTKIKIHTLKVNKITDYIDKYFAEDNTTGGIYKLNPIVEEEIALSDWEGEFAERGRQIKLALDEVSKRQGKTESEIADLKKQLDETAKKIESINMSDPNMSAHEKADSVFKDCMDKAKIKVKIKMLESKRMKFVEASLVVNRFDNLIKKDIESFRQKAQELSKKAE